MSPGTPRHPGLVNSGSRFYGDGGLRRRFLSFFGLVSLVAIILLGGSIIVFVQRTEAAAWQARQTEAAAGAAQTVSAFIARARHSLQLAGLLDAGVLAANPDILAEMTRRNPELLEVVLFDRAGILLGNAHTDRAILAQMFTAAQSEWFLEARAGRPYISPVFLTTQDAPYVIVSQPLASGFVLAARVDLPLLWDVVADIRFGQTGQAYIVDSFSQVIAHTDPHVVLAPTLLQGRTEYDRMQASQDMQWTGEYRSLSGVPVVGAAAPIPGTTWRVVTELAQSEAYQTSQFALIAIGLGAFAIAGIMSYTVARLFDDVVRDPLRHLEQGAHRLGQGDLRHRVAIASNHEIDRVAAAFNLMADQLCARDTDLAQRTAALESSESRYRLLADHVGDVIWQRDLTLRQEYISPSVERLRGYTVAEAMTHSLAETLAPDSAQRAAAFLTAMLAETAAVPSTTRRQKERALELEVLRKDGTTVWTETLMSFLTNPDGQPTGILGVTRDITERRSAEAALRRANEVLEANVGARTRELAESKAFLAALQGTATRVAAATDHAQVFEALKAALEPLGVTYRFSLPGASSPVGAPPAENASELVLPLTTRHRSLGTMALWGRPFDPDATAALTALASQVAIALETTSLLEAEQARLKALAEMSAQLQAELSERRLAEVRLQAFSALGYRLSQATQPEEAAQVIVDVARDLLGSSACTLELFGSEPEPGRGSEAGPEGAVRPQPQGPTFEHPSPDARPDPATRSDATLTVAETGRTYRVPVRHGPHQLGMLSLQAHAPDADDPQWLYTLQALADHCGGALERINAEAERRRIEERLRRITDNMLDLVAQTDVNGNLQYVSPSARSIFGLDPEQLMGQPILATLMGSDPEAVQAIAKTLGGGGTAARLEHRYFRPDGTWLWLESVTSALRTPDNQVSGAIVASRDISERKQAEMTLQHQLHFERLVADMSTRFASVSDLELDSEIQHTLAVVGQFIDADRSYLFLHDSDGYVHNTHEWCAPGVPSQMTRFQHIPEKDFPWWYEQLNRGRVLHMGPHISLPPEAAAERAFLETLDVQSLLLFPILSPRGGLGFLGLDSLDQVRDWTEVELVLLRTVSEILASALDRRAVDLALRQRFDQLQAITFLTGALNQSQTLEGIYQAAVEGVIQALDVGRVSLLLFDAEKHLDFVAWRGLSDAYRRKVAGHSPWPPGTIDPEPILVPDVRTAPFLAELLPTFADENIQAVAFVPITHQGRLLGKFMLYYADPHDFAPHEIPLIQSVANYVGIALERKRAEADLAMANQELEGALRRANEYAAAAQEASQLKTEFLANTSHELRTPLTGILGSLGLIMEGACSSPTEVLDLVDLAHQASNHLLGIINSVLDIAKIEAGRLDVVAEPISINGALEEVYGLCKVQAANRGLAFEIDYLPNSAPPAIADPEKFRQILLNLLGNALKFTERGRIEVLAAVTDADPTGPHIQIQIRDTGIGIPAERQSRLFQAFVQADGSTTRRFGGTGLGLAISRRLAELMGGELTLFSAGEGHGTTFTLTLPTHLDH